MPINTPTTTDTLWQSGASIQTLKARAELYKTIRRYFSQLGVMEVDIPTLAASAGTDPFIELIPATTNQQPHFLQSSPEFFMKRLLSCGSGDIFSLGKAFRNEERGPRHNPEFTILEWYRLELNEQQLASEVVNLIQLTLPKPLATHQFSYRELFETTFGINPHQCTSNALKALAKQHLDIQWDDDDPDVWLDLLMTHVIEPSLPAGIVIIDDYPQSQAALARIVQSNNGDRVAKRFEIYLDGMELANGYWELTDRNEQQQRFEQDTQKRQQLGLKKNPIDQHLLSALSSGLPECAGVALGVDRLLMKLCALSHIDQALSFSFNRI